MGEDGEDTVATRLTNVVEAIQRIEGEDFCDGSIGLFADGGVRGEAQSDGPGEDEGEGVFLEPGGIDAREGEQEMLGEGGRIVVEEGDDVFEGFGEIDSRTGAGEAFLPGGGGEVGGHANEFGDDVGTGAEGEDVDEGGAWHAGEFFAEEREEVEAAEGGEGLEGGEGEVVILVGDGGEDEAHGVGRAAALEGAEEVGGDGRAKGAMDIEDALERLISLSGGESIEEAALAARGLALHA